MKLASWLLQFSREAVVIESVAVGETAQQLSVDFDPQTGRIAEPRMVGWYDPKQLWQTAKQVIVSTIIGRHADRRLLEDLATESFFFDFSAASAQPASASSIDENEVKPQSLAIPAVEQELWIDYVSDVGDGWNPTYAVAYWLAQVELDLPAGKLKRGNILIFGGDEVYPTADRAQYRQRLETPYAAALHKKPDELPYAFVIPGNHDWYDSLASFSEVFTGWFAKRFVGRWQTFQNRSYFALKLPHRWWLLGIDVQLTHDLDEPQVKYFEQLSQEHMQAGDRVILCCAEPFWIFNEVYNGERERYQHSNVRHLVEDILREKTIAVYLAGDLHHYQRITNAVDGNGEDGVLRITSGGGGAFLHPTHGESANAFADEAHTSKCYPEPRVSQKLCWRNLRFFSRSGFLWRNRWFGLVTAVPYLLTAWFMLAGIGAEGRSELLQAADKAQGTLVGAWQAALSAAGAAWGGTLFQSPFLVFIGMLVILGFLAFTDTHSMPYRILAGGTHAFAHLAVAPFIGWLGYVFYDWLYAVCASLSLPQLLHTWIAWAGAISLVGLGGWVAGSCIMACYLFISLNVFGRHSNEAFSSLQIEDWKNFLRMKLDAQGNLTIYPIGLRRVPRRWRKARAEEQSCSRFIPDDARASSPELIEAPLTYPPQRS